MDLKMPGMGGSRRPASSCASAPHIGVVVLTMVQDDDAVFAAMRAGARGYLLKGARRAEIVLAIRAVADGDGSSAPRSPAGSSGTSTPRPPRTHSFPNLTPREGQVLTLMARHLPNPAIAHQLGISEKTVRNNVSAILVKLRVADRSRAIILAKDAGLGS